MHPQPFCGAFTSCLTQESAHLLPAGERLVDYIHGLHVSVHAVGQAVLLRAVQPFARFSGALVVAILSDLVNQVLGHLDLHLLLHLRQVGVFLLLSRLGGGHGLFSVAQQIDMISICLSGNEKSGRLNGGGVVVNQMVLIVNTDWALS